MAVTVDATSSSGSIGAVSSFNWNHTTSSGSNTVLVVVVTKTNDTNDRTVTGVTFGADTLTRLQENRVAAPSHNDADIWYEVNPTVQTAAITVTFNAGQNGTCEAGAISFFGATTPNNATNLSDGSHNGTQTITVTSDSNSIVVAGWSVNNSSWSAVSDNQIYRMAQTNDVAMNYGTGAASKNITATQAGTANSNGIACNVPAVAVAAAVSKYDNLLTLGVS